MMLTHLRHATHNLLRLPDWLAQCLPSSCALCARSGRTALCVGCRQRYFHMRVQRCVQCAMPMPATITDSHCGDCLQRPPAFDATIVAADYLPPVDQLVLALKFGARLTLAPLLADLLAQALQQQTTLPPPQLLAPVPLATERLQERGFNQSLEIARPLARRLELPLIPQLLQRVRATAAQAKLPAAQRRRNIRAAFAVSNAAMQQVRDCHIGVVDDVITTGETLGEIASTLKHYGARRVTNLVFCRTLPK